MWLGTVVFGLGSSGRWGLCRGLGKGLHAERMSECDDVLMMVNGVGTVGIVILLGLACVNEFLG